jgi:hypothetical protein
MKNPIQLTKTIDPVRNSFNRLPWRRGFLLISCALVLASFALSPPARAVDPPPDGGYYNANTAEGDNALFNLDTRIGLNNTAVGFEALFNNTEGSNNTATGASALFSNTTGSQNTANGEAALYSTTGNNNTANGYRALFGTPVNPSGSNNTAIGSEALLSNSTGSYNTANGVQALYSNTAGIDNTAHGNFALYFNTTGSNNTAIGLNALYYTTGSSNIALGFAAGVNLTTGNNNIDIGNYGVAGESKKIRIGTTGTHNNTYIAGIYGVTVSRGIGVIVDSTGHLGTTTSSARFKDNIKPMDKTSEAILSLQPVTFRYKHELDPDGIPQFGLVAEEVAKVNPDLVAHDEEGKPYTVRYEAVNAMLLNEFLKEHRKVEQLETKVTRQEKDFQTAIAEQRKEIKALTARLTEQAAQIQKVNDHLELSKAAPRMIANNQ